MILNPELLLIRHLVKFCLTIVPFVLHTLMQKDLHTMKLLVEHEQNSPNT